MKTGNIYMKKLSPLIKGTLTLTVAALISRLMGFVYRIYLAGTIGSEGMGLYQLISPVLTFSFALCALGIQTSISKLVSEKPKKAFYYLICGMLISVSASTIIAVLVYVNADFLATNWFKDVRLISLLKILSFAIPLACAHSCINGYYYGKSTSSIPAISQLVEQISRISTVYIAAQFKNVTPEITVLALVCGEGFGAVFSIISLKLHRHFSPSSLKNLGAGCLEIFKLSIFLTTNRVCIHFLSAIETILLPQMLIKTGLDYNNALSTYGVLTGMAIPLILFPSALINSFSVMLLPEVSKRNAVNNKNTLSTTCIKSISFAIMFGMVFTAFFIVFGHKLGSTIFKSPDVGIYVKCLAFLCPFIYLSNTLSSILNGLGKTKATFKCALTSHTISLIFVIFLVPKLGIYGYMLGLLFSHIIESIMFYISLSKYCSITFDATKIILAPGICIVIGTICAQSVGLTLCNLHMFNTFFNLLLAGSLYLIISFVLYIKLVLNK